MVALVDDEELNLLVFVVLLAGVCCEEVPPIGYGSLAGSEVGSDHCVNGIAVGREDAAGSHRAAVERGTYHVSGRSRCRCGCRCRCGDASEIELHGAPDGEGEWAAEADFTGELCDDGVVVGRT